MISVFGSDITELEINAAANVMRSQWSGFGKVVEEFEADYSQKFSIPNFLMVDSGSNALYMAIHLLDLPPGSEIIVPSFTWVSCAQAVLLCGHKPVFCDVDIDTMNVTVEHIKKHIGPLTKAIMVVHYAGLPVEMKPILELGLPVIEDAAHAIASTYNGTPCGVIGDVGIYSFDAVKNLTVGEGGGLASRHSHFIERAKTLRYCGIGKSGFDAASSLAKNSRTRWWEYNITEPFIKMLPINIHAAIGIEQLKRIDHLQQRRKEVWASYQTSFAPHNIIQTPPEAKDGDTHSYFTYCIRVPCRDELAHYLLGKGIYTTLRYHPLHMNPLYDQQHLSLTNSETLNETALSIPLHPRLSDDDVQYIVDSITEFYQ